jgi:cytochrome P450 family 110
MRVLHACVRLCSRAERALVIPLMETFMTMPPRVELSPFTQTYRALRDRSAFLDECSQRYGDMFMPRIIGAPRLAFVNDPEAIRQVFALPPDVARGGEANFRVEFALGRGSLMLLDGAAHDRARRLLMPSFHGERLSAYLRQMVEETERVLAAIPLGSEFSMRRAMQSVTLGVMMACIFGLEPGPRTDRFRNLVQDLTDLALRPLVGGLCLLINPTRLRMFLTTRHAALADRLRALFGLDRLLPLAELARCMREIDGLLYESVRAARSPAGRTRVDVLSMLVEARDEHGRGLSDSELRDQMMTMLAAGHETTGTALTFIMQELHTNPTVRAAVEEELERVLQGGELTTASLRELRYLEAVIKESLRLYGAAPSFGRKLSQPTQIGKFELPAGVAVVGSCYVVHRNPRIWDDPLRFDPRRFLDQKARPGAFFPFGGGPRLCIGMAFAMFELKVVTATLLMRAKLRVVPGPKLESVQRGIVFGPSHDAPFVLEARGTSSGTRAQPRELADAAVH